MRFLAKRLKMKYALIEVSVHTGYPPSMIKVITVQVFSWCPLEFAAKMHHADRVIHKVHMSFIFVCLK